MTSTEKLDYVLTYLNNGMERSEKLSDIKTNLKFSGSDKELYLILQKLCDDGYVTIGYGKTGGQPNEIKHYYISFHGKEFNSNGGYLKKKKTLKQQEYWTITKTIANSLNAVLILIIGGIGVWVAYDSEGKDKKFESYENQIELLNSKIDSLKLIIAKDTTIKK